MFTWTCMCDSITSPKLRFFSSSASATWMSKRFTMNTPKSRCSHSSLFSASNITFRICGAVKTSFSSQQKSWHWIASIA